MPGGPVPPVGNTVTVFVLRRLDAQWPSPAASPLFCITPIRLGVPNVTEIEAPAALCVAADPLAVATPSTMVAVNETADMVVLP